MKTDQTVDHLPFAHFWRHVLIGFFTVAPLWVTWLVFDFLLGMLARAGAPAALGHAGRRAAHGIRPVMHVH